MRWARASRRLVLAVALVSAGALAYQLLLVRWLAIAHWSTFAAMIISLALLGHGASGTWLGLWLHSARHRFEQLFPAAALLFALAAVLVLALARGIPFNGLELVWDARQILWLGALYLLLALPFFFAATCFGLAFARFGAGIPLLYGADLLGAGAGALLAVALMPLALPHALMIAASCGLLAALLTAPRRVTWLVAWVLSAGLLVALLTANAIAPPINEFKGLSKALLLPEARAIAQRHGPYGWLAVLESPRVPLRHAPGLSLSNLDEPPPQLGLFTDGEALSPIIHRREAEAAPAYLTRMTSALPYRLRTQPRVLVLAAGGGQDVLQALGAGARHVTVVELDPRRIELVRDTFGGYAGDLYRDPRVRVVIAEPRAFARATRERFDVVVLGSGESFAGAGAGVQAASEQYALTVEAVRDYLRVLAPGGLLAITRYSKQPPRDELKLLATAVAAMEGGDRNDIDRRLLAIRAWDASTLLLGNAVFDEQEIAAARAFAREHSFDPVYYPGMPATEANRFNRVERAWLYEGAKALLSSDVAAFVRDYKFAIAPATDDRPYFSDYFRWRSLPEIWRLRAQGGAVLLDSGYLLLLAALVQAVPLALLLVLLPLRVRRRDTAVAALPPRLRVRIAGYFIALGLAFLLVEIATLSRLTLLVGHPLLAVTAGLAGFLVFAGLGSVFAQRLLGRREEQTIDAAIARRIGWAVAGIAAGLAWQWVVFALVFSHGAQWPVAARALAGLVGIAPLAFAMGMPFPLGLAGLARSHPVFVPWAWGLNGFASVVAAIAAVLLAMAIGLRATLLSALALYVFAAWVWRPQYRSTGSTSSDQRTRRASGSA